MHDQVLIVLDADDPIVFDAVEPHLPTERRERHRFTYRQCGGPALKRHGPEQTPVDWDGVAAGVTALAAEAHALADRADRPISFWITGKAPLPAFVQLGLELSPWLSTQTLLNQRPDGVWDTLELGAESSASAEYPLDIVKGLGLPEPSVTTARIAVYIDTAGRHPPLDAIRRYLNNQGEELGALVEIRAGVPCTVDASNATAIYRQLKESFSRLPGDYPQNSGLALFVAGPTTLAYLVGRAINIHQFRDILLPDFAAGQYTHALRLPRGRRRNTSLDHSAERVLLRRGVLDQVLAGIEELRSGLTAEHLLPYVSETTAAHIIETLQALAISKLAEGDAFSLSILRRRLSFGNGLLDALGKLDRALQSRIGQILSTSVRRLGGGSRYFEINGRLIFRALAEI
ncbi:MAG: hypothetical protein ACFCUJ_09595 [Thiotrichales bacterium]